MFLIALNSDHICEHIQLTNFTFAEMTMNIVYKCEMTTYNLYHKPYNDHEYNTRRTIITLCLSI